MTTPRQVQGLRPQDDCVKAPASGDPKARPSPPGSRSPSRPGPAGGRGSLTGTRGCPCARGASASPGNGRGGPGPDAEGARELSHRGFDRDRGIQRRDDRRGVLEVPDLRRKVGDPAISESAWRSAGRCSFWRAKKWAGTPAANCAKRASARGRWWSNWCLEFPARRARPSGPEHGKRPSATRRPSPPGHLHLQCHSLHFVLSENRYMHRPRIAGLNRLYGLSGPRGYQEMGKCKKARESH